VGIATRMCVFAVGGNPGMALGPILALSVVHYQGYSSLPWMILPALGFTAVIMALQKVVAIPGAEESVSRKAKGERPKGTR
ncbi:MAG TPA: MFS transporter, partial [Syntrophobacteraceae bacterium]|nr:MFS transporter [Syntrophobacteraceae bacterium]